MDPVKIVELDRDTPIELGQRVHAVLLAGETSDDFTFVWRRLAPGRPMGIYHAHEYAENLIIVLEGTMDAIVDGKSYKVQKNECIYMPKGLGHATGNLSDSEVHAVEIYAPGLERNGKLDRIEADLPEEIPAGDPVRVSIPIEEAAQRPSNPH